MSPMLALPGHGIRAIAAGLALRTHNDPSIEEVSR
jgi:hypothetical protein